MPISSLMLLNGLWEASVLVTALLGALIMQYNLRITKANRCLCVV